MGFGQIEPEFFWQVYRKRVDLWQMAAQELCQRLQIPSDRFETTAAGSNLIARVSEHVMLKIFPPFHRHQWESEYRVMQHLDGQLQLPIPRYLGAGDAGEDWTYLVMSRLQGITLDLRWPTLDVGEKKRILFDIGKIMARVHAVTVGDLATLAPDWNAFVQGQVKACRARHLKLGMPPWFTDQVDDYVQHMQPLLPQAFAPVILTGEYTPFNLMVPAEGPLEKVSGMIDFGDAMIGFADYDLLGPSLFLCEGHPELVAALLDGYDRRTLTKELQDRLMLLQILHRYSDFHGQLSLKDWQLRAKSIEDLKNLIWPLV